MFEKLIIGALLKFRKEFESILLNLCSLSEATCFVVAPREPRVIFIPFVANDIDKCTTGVKYQNCHKVTGSRDRVASRKNIQVTALAASNEYIMLKYRASVRPLETILFK